MKIDLNDDVFKDPDILIQYFSHFGFDHFKKHRNYITFAVDEDGDPFSISCYFDKDRAIAIDYVRDVRSDIIGFVCQERKVNFNEAVVPLLQLVDGKYFGAVRRKRKYPFGGFFHRNQCADKNQRILNEEIVLKQYEAIGNQRFLDDGISFRTQRFFNIGYLPKNDLITIPIYSSEGDLIGVKGRYNADVTHGPKYIHLYECSQSQTLYGFYENQQFLKEAEVIYVFEAEKSVMQAFSFGVRNCVAIGSCDLSKKQCELLFSLNPEKIVLMLDQGLPQNKIDQNVQLLNSLNQKRNSFFKLETITIGYWKPSKEEMSKASPTDHGKKHFKEIIKKQLIFPQLQKEEKITTETDSDWLNWL